MSAQTDLEIAAARGVRAERLMADDILCEAFKILEDAYTSAWRSTLIEDVSGREKLFLAVNIVGKVRDHLQRAAADGQVAQAELRAIAETAERKKSWHQIT